MYKIGQIVRVKSLIDGKIHQAAIVEINPEIRWEYKDKGVIIGGYENQIINK
jgi:hypothetical protein